MMPTGSVSVSGSNATASVGNPKLDAADAVEEPRSGLRMVLFERLDDLGRRLLEAPRQLRADDQTIRGLPQITRSVLMRLHFVAACGGTGSDWATITNLLPVARAAQIMTWTYSCHRRRQGRTVVRHGNQLAAAARLPAASVRQFRLLGTTPTSRRSRPIYDSNWRRVFYDGRSAATCRATSYNATVYYDDTVFQTRLTAAFRSH